jgi:hypothetical protein
MMLLSSLLTTRRWKDRFEREKVVIVDKVAIKHVNDEFVSEKHFKLKYFTLKTISERSSEKNILNQYDKFVLNIRGFHTTFFKKWNFLIRKSLFPKILNLLKTLWMSQRKFSYSFWNDSLINIKMMSHLSKLTFSKRFAIDNSFSNQMIFSTSKMSRINTKKKMQIDLHHFYLVENVAVIIEHELNEALMYQILFENLKHQRYFFSSRSLISKSIWIASVLFNLSETRFRSYVKMNRYSFKHVVNLIRQNVAFQNKSTCSQVSVKNQLQYALYRLKHDDSFSEFVFIATFWKVSKNLIFNFTKRVVETLCRLKDTYIKWSNARTRTRESLINDDRESEFIEMIEKVDETNIVLSIKSNESYEDKLFFNRKKRYAMNLCAMYDINKKFIYFFTDWSNSQHDQRIFAADNQQSTVESSKSDY